jgi:hypothetical protein
MVQPASTFLQFVENPDITWQGCWANISPPPFKIIERNAKRKICSNETMMEAHTQGCVLLKNIG